MKRAKPFSHLRAFTLIEVLVVLAILAILALFYLMSATRIDKPHAPMAECQNNLKQIGLAFRVWDGDYGMKYPMSVPIGQGGTKEFNEGPNAFRHFQVMSNEINNPQILVCRADTRTAATSFASMSNANVSYFVGLDTDETRPAMLLSGDRNLLTNALPIGTGLCVLTTNAVLSWSTSIHNLAGNVGLADGSVQQVTSSSLQKSFS